MSLKTRKPTGLAPWPITLVAGAEKAGKSWSAAEASGSDLIGRTLWIGIGEDDPDEYALIPGANFEIVEHAGTYRSILDELTNAVAEPQGDKPTLIVVDSMTRLWDLIVGDVQEIANRRARAKAQKYNKPVSDDDVQISMDLWNTAKQRWEHIIDTLRFHTGPVVLTARLKQVTVMDANGKPTTEKTWKIEAEKSLPYDVGAIVELPARGEAYLSGVRSTRLQLESKTRLKTFTVDALWRNMGLDTAQTAPRQHAATRVESAPDAPAPAPPVASAPAGRDWLAEVAAATDTLTLRQIYADAKAAGAPPAVASAITARAEALTQEEPLPAAPPPASDPEADQRWLDGQAA